MTFPTKEQIDLGARALYALQFDEATLPFNDQRKSRTDPFVFMAKACLTASQFGTPCFAVKVVQGNFIMADAWRSIAEKRAEAMTKSTGYEHTVTPGWFIGREDK